MTAPPPPAALSRAGQASGSAYENSRHPPQPGPARRRRARVHVPPALLDRTRRETLLRCIDPPPASGSPAGGGEARGHVAAPPPCTRVVRGHVAAPPRSAQRVTPKLSTSYCRTRPSLACPAPSQGEAADADTEHSGWLHNHLGAAGSRAGGGSIPRRRGGAGEGVQSILAVDLLLSAVRKVTAAHPSHACKAAGRTLLPRRGFKRRRCHASNGAARDRLCSRKRGFQAPPACVPHFTPNSSVMSFMVSDSRTRDGSFSSAFCSLLRPSP